MSHGRYVHVRTIAICLVVSVLFACGLVYAASLISSPAGSSGSYAAAAAPASNAPSAAAAPASSVPSAAAAPAPATVGQPAGDPLGRKWAPALDDEFNGTAIDKSKWVALGNWGNNNVHANPKNCTEGGGHLILALPGDGTGCDLYSSRGEGAGKNARSLGVDQYLEARIYFPGPGSGPTSTLYNWPAFWAYDGSGNWKGGENDIAEALNKMEYNYHSAGLGHDPSLSPSGNWGNSWHVYGLYRTKTLVKVYYDGVLQGTLNVNDNGTAEPIMFTSGESDKCCGAPSAHGAAANVLVDWVRLWKVAS